MAYAWKRLSPLTSSSSSLVPSRLCFRGEPIGPVFLGLSLFMIKPAASDMLSFLRGYPCPRTGDVCLRFWARASKSGVDASINAEKSGMLFGRDMALQNTAEKTCRYVEMKGETTQNGRTGKKQAMAEQRMQAERG